MSRCAVCGEEKDDLLPYDHEGGEVCKDCVRTTLSSAFWSGVKDSLRGLSKR